MCALPGARSFWSSWSAALPRFSYCPTSGDGSLADWVGVQTGRWQIGTECTSVGVQIRSACRSSRRADKWSAGRFECRSRRHAGQVGEQIRPASKSGRRADQVGVQVDSSADQLGVQISSASRSTRRPDWVGGQIVGFACRPRRHLRLAAASASAALPPRRLAASSASTTSPPHAP